MHFIIGLFLLSLILAVPALRVVALILFVFGGLAIGGLMLATQHQNAQIHEWNVAHPYQGSSLTPKIPG
jgi:hypothetical protein